MSSIRTHTKVSNNIWVVVIDYLPWISLMVPRLEYLKELVVGEVEYGWDRRPVFLLRTYIIMRNINMDKYEYNSQGNNLGRSNPCVQSIYKKHHQLFFKKKTPKGMGYANSAIASLHPSPKPPASVVWKHPPVPPPVLRSVIPCVFSWLTISFSRAPSRSGYEPDPMRERGAKINRVLAFVKSDTSSYTQTIGGSGEVSVIGSSPKPPLPKLLFWKLQTTPESISIARRINTWNKEIKTGNWLVGNIVNAIGDMESVKDSCILFAGTVGAWDGFWMYIKLRLADVWDAIPEI